MKILICLIALSMADIVNIDADDYPLYSSMSQPHPDITFFYSQGGPNLIDGVMSTDYTHPDQFLGNRVIGNGPGGEFWTYGQYELVAIFNGLARIVRISSLGKWNYICSNMIIEAFDPNGVFLAKNFRGCGDGGVSTLTLDRGTGNYDIGYVHMYGATPSQICLDNLMVNYEPACSWNTLTIDSDANGLDPPAGEHLVCGDAQISASTYHNCPDTYEFDYWIGDVADPNSAQTIVFMDSDKTVQPFYQITAECGDQCHPDNTIGDFNNDCIVDGLDLAELSLRWLSCTKPECD